MSEFLNPKFQQAWRICEHEILRAKSIRRMRRRRLFFAWLGHVKIEPHKKTTAGCKCNRPLTKCEAMPKPFVFQLDMYGRKWR